MSIVDTERPDGVAVPLSAREAPRRQLPAVTVIVPARNERENLPPLLAEIGEALAGEAFEVIVVDDGSDDGTGEAVAAFARRHPWLRLLAHDRPAGKSAAIRSAARAARGDILVTVDGDGQNDPRFLEALIRLLREAPAVALVAGERAARHDGLLKKRASRLANAVRRRLLADATRDTACGLKAIRRDVYLSLPFFDNNHRFLPALVLREGHEVRHVEVRDRPRAHGRSKYGVLDRALVGLPDLLGVWWLRRRRAVRPRVEERDLT